MIKEYNFNNAINKFDINDYKVALNMNKENEYIFSFILNQDWSKELSSFSEQNEKIILIRNCPIDEIIPLSPIDEGYIETDKYNVTKSFILNVHKIMHLIPYAYKIENKGRVFRSVVPLKSFENTYSSYGAKERIDFHSDNPTYKMYPEYSKNSLNSPELLSLFCMRGKENVYTEIVVLSQILKELNSETIKELEKNQFTVNTPDSFDKYVEIKNVSILNKYKDRYYTRFSYHNIKATSTIGKKAIEKFINAIDLTEKVKINLKKGDFIIFKNQEVLHSRNKFETTYDGYDRWLLRVYSASNIKYIDNNNINKL